MHALPPTHAATLLTAGLLAALLSGCTNPANDQLRFGVERPVFDQPKPTERDTPSVTGLDRSHWEPTLFLTPVHGVAHAPTYRPNAFDLDTLARQRGDFPTVEQSLEMGEPDTGAEIGLAARTHGLAMLDALLLIPRIIIRPPSATDWSPSWTYQRTSPTSLTSPPEAHAPQSAPDPEPAPDTHADPSP